MNHSLDYKVLTGLVDVDANEFFSYVNSGHNTRGHCLKLLGQQCRVSTRKFFFTERVIEPWNSLPATAHDFSSLSKFKTFLKKVDFSKFVSATWLQVTIFCIVRPLLQICNAIPISGICRFVGIVVHVAAVSLGFWSLCNLFLNVSWVSNKIMNKYIYIAPFAIRCRGAWVRATIRRKKIHIATSVAIYIIAICHCHVTTTITVSLLPLP